MEGPCLWSMRLREDTIPGLTLCMIRHHDSSGRNRYFHVLVTSGDRAHRLVKTWQTASGPRVPRHAR